MNSSRIPVEHRLALYDYHKKRRLEYQECAHQLLGNNCSNCPSTDGLRIRPVDPYDGIVRRYRGCPVTFYRRLCLEPELRKTVHLLCRACRLRANDPNRDQALDPSKSLKGSN
jgi:hypothetical protein